VAPCFYALEDVYVVGVDGKDEDLRVGEEVPDLAGRRNAVHNWHVDVHEYDVREQLRAHLDAALPVVGHADYLHALLSPDDRPRPSVKRG
jgi:hypothetical protein